MQSFFAAIDDTRIFGVPNYELYLPTKVVFFT